MNGRSTPRGPWSGGPGGISLPPLTPAPRDLVILLAVVFATYSLGAFPATAWFPALFHLGNALWPLGLVWQVFTYPFAGFGPPSVWILLHLLILYWFARDVFYRLGRRRFWRTLLTATVTAGVAAVTVQTAVMLLSGRTNPPPILLLQGQWALLTFAIAAFATLNRHATILLMFVLPIQARWFLWIEVLLAFIGFLMTHDLAGFTGICVLVGGTYALLSAGGPARLFRDWSLRAKRRRLERQLECERKKRRLRVLEGGGEKGEEPRRGPWVH